MFYLLVHFRCSVVYTRCLDCEIEISLSRGYEISHQRKKSPINTCMHLYAERSVVLSRPCSGETIFYGITIRFILSFYISDFNNWWKSSSKALPYAHKLMHNNDITFLFFSQPRRTLLKKKRSLFEFHFAIKHRCDIKHFFRSKKFSIGILITCHVRMLCHQKRAFKSLRSLCNILKLNPCHLGQQRYRSKCLLH